MAKVNEPQRVITRGRTRTIGEPRRPHEPSGTVKERAADRPVTGAPRSVASRASSEQGTSRAVVEPRREAPRATADERRPLDRIAALEQQVARLELVLFGDGQEAVEGQDAPLVMAIADLEAVSARVCETVGVLVEKVGDMGDEEHAPSGIMKTVADLSDRMAAVGPAVEPRDTEPPSSAEGSPRVLGVESAG